MKKIALFILSITLLTACSDFQDVTFSGVENFKIISLTQSGVEAEITAKIKNPNKTAFTIYKSEFDATLGGINAGKAHITKNVRIKPNSEEVYTFIIKSDFSKLSIADMPRIIGMASSKNIKVGLKGNMKVGKLFVKKSVPVDFTKSVPLSGF